MIIVDERKCLHCVSCVGVCPHMALTMMDMHVESNENCKSCGWCIIACPVAALTLKEA